MKQAIRKRWPIPPEMKQALMDRMAELLQDEPDIAVGAARVIVAAELQNQNDILKRRAKDARVQIQQILQMAEPAAPDPEYLAWKQQQLLELDKCGQTTFQSVDAPVESGAGKPESQQASPQAEPAPEFSEIPPQAWPSSPLRQLVDQRRIVGALDARRGS